VSWVFDSLNAAVGSKLPPGLSAEQQRQEQSADKARECGRKVRDVMTCNVWTVTLDASLAEVVHLMERHNIKRIPVVEANKIVGIVTRAKLLHAMASFVHEVPASSIEDAAIREQLLAVLETQSWTPAIDVAVRNGVVHARPPFAPNSTV
jgi:CBS domain-containing protein